MDEKSRRSAYKAYEQNDRRLGVAYVDYGSYGQAYDWPKKVVGNRKGTVKVAHWSGKLVHG